MAVAHCPILKAAWSHAIPARNGAARRARTLVDHTVDDTGPWGAVVRKIVAFQQRSDDWDRFGAAVPSREVVESALGLAYCFQERGVAPPQRVIASSGGEVVFEWQDPDGIYTEVEIDAPLHAEVMVVEPGKPARQWTLPAE